MKVILTTERALIREFNPGDWQHVREMNSDTDVMRSIGNGEVKPVEDEKRGFENILFSYNNGNGLGVWAITIDNDNTFIGAASLTILDNTNEIQLGYRFKKQYWGLGYATEITKGLIEYGFGHLRLKRIVATTNLTNNKSRKVLEKAGLAFEKTGKFYGMEMNYFAIAPLG